MQNCRLMEIAKGSQVIFSHQDIWVPQEGQLVALDIDGVFPNLDASNRYKKAVVKHFACHQSLSCSPASLS